MTFSEVNDKNMRRILEITDKRSSEYVDLPAFLAKFSYPVSLELSEYIGCKAYQRGFADALEFICIMVNKYYTLIRQNSSHRVKDLIEEFIIREGDRVKAKTEILISTVKKWEVGSVEDRELANAIDEFCKMYGVGLYLTSFFLRMLLPGKFGTLDRHVINALRSLGFEVRVYDGLSYLRYNRLLEEIGRRYEVPSEIGGTRCLTPSEVDMALYQYDKERTSKQGAIHDGNKKEDRYNALFDDIIWDESMEEKTWREYGYPDMTIDDLPDGFEDIIHPEGEGDYDVDNPP